jgi:SAM-dependent methyltransferase
MAIKEIQFSKSEDFIQEMKALESQSKDEFTKDIHSSEEYFKKWFNTGAYTSLISLSKKLKNPIKIMDIGGGNGATSIYLASRGHKVTVVEPSMFFCSIIDEISSQLNLDIDIYSCSAEAIDKILDTNYDACIFHSSLHHCDDPVKSLKHCREKLTWDGSVYLLSELRIPFFLSKKKFHERLISDPVGMGHYGGNEHPYYLNEYRKMLQEAGFDQVLEIIPEDYYYPREIIKSKINQKIDDKYTFSDAKIIIRYIFYVILSRIVRNSVTLSILKTLSLINVDYIGIKKMNL